jgi:hypothetical protein
MLAPILKTEIEEKKWTRQLREINLIVSNTINSLRF